MQKNEKYKCKKNAQMRGCVPPSHLVPLPHQPQPARFGNLHHLHQHHHLYQCNHHHPLHLHQHHFRHHLYQCLHHHLHHHHFHHHLLIINHHLHQSNCHPTPPLHHHHPYQPQPARFGNRLLCFFSDFIMFIIFNGLS